MIRHDWTIEEIKKIYDQPLLNLIFEAQKVHQKFHSTGEVQLCSLLSIKTGACAEDCGYCSQSAQHKTSLQPTPIMSVDEVLEQAQRAKEIGSTRFCMGAAWRQPKEGKSFEAVLEMVRGVKRLGLEVCVTLGMLTQDQADRLKEAGLTSYNHNLDTSPEFYKNIISTRTYEDRLETLKYVRNAGLSICCGGIIGMGETILDRCSLLATLAIQNPHPESVPVNALVPIKGTPLENAPSVQPLDLAHMIAAARIVMPKSLVRLSAGRSQLTKEAQALCFLAGANSIFYGEELLTTPNAECNEDLDLLTELGLKQMAPSL